MHSGLGIMLAWDLVTMRIEQLRHLIWYGYHREARNELVGMRHLVSEVAYMDGKTFRPPIARLLCNCDELRRYLASNTELLFDYGTGYHA